MPKVSNSSLVYGYVAKKIGFLENSVNTSKVKAELAQLRRGLGKQPGELPELWGEFLLELPEELQGKSKNPSKAELAIYQALVLYAYHQQGHDLPKKSMNLKGQGLGKGIRKLVPNGDTDAEDRILKRFKRVVSASTINDVAVQLRSIISLLKGNDIPIDYPALAVDLYFLQIPEAKNNIKLAWARDFYAFNSNENEEEKRNDEK
jgi:CRISPR system Cascade subunit CasB